MAIKIESRTRKVDSKSVLEDLKCQASVYSMARSIWHSSTNIADNLKML